MLVIKVHRSDGLWAVASVMAKDQSSKILFPAAHTNDVASQKLHLEGKGEYYWERIIDPVRKIDY